MTVWSEFQPLQTVVLGRLFDTENLLSFLSLSPKWQQYFKAINEQALNELELISTALTNSGVEVLRTTPYNIQTNEGPAGPPLSPRDWLLVYGNKTILGNDAFVNHNVRTHSTDHLLQYYIRMPHNDIWANEVLGELNSQTLQRPYMHTANILRCGMDVFITQDLGKTGNEIGRKWIIDELKSINPNVRIHNINCEEHLDGYLFFVKPGLVLSRFAKDRLPEFFKHWDVIQVDESVEVYNKVMQYKWKKLNPIVAQQYAWFLQTNPEETMFSINGLSINESTVMFPGKSPVIFSQLEKRGIDCISVDMKAISYWDSGLHCCTSELQRSGELADYS